LEQLTSPVVLSIGQQRVKSFVNTSFLVSSARQRAVPRTVRHDLRATLCGFSSLSNARLSPTPAVGVLPCPHCLSISGCASLSRLHACFGNCKIPCRCCVTTPAPFSASELIPCRSLDFTITCCTASHSLLLHWLFHGSELILMTTTSCLRVTASSSRASFATSRIEGSAAALSEI